MIDCVSYPGDDNSSLFKSPPRRMHRQIKTEFYFAYLLYPFGNIGVFAVKIKFQIKTAYFFQKLPF